MNGPSIGPELLPASNQSRRAALRRLCATKVAASRRRVAAGQVLLTIFTSAAITASAALRPERLECEYQAHPLALETTRTRLSWVLEGGKKPRRGQCQTAYHVLVASSDLSHYDPAPGANARDAAVVGDVERLDVDGLMARLEADPSHACGGGPMVSAMRAAQALGASDARVLKYGDSGDVSGDKDAVVGYLAAAFGRFNQA